jgi:CheY-like chemotaxis protein
MSKIVLCADDSATMQKVAEITFDSTDWTYVGAKSLDEAVAAAKKEKPALVLADAIMGDQSGYDLCKAIKSEMADVKVVMMCGNSEAYDESKGKAAGADGHVTKPWDTQKLLEKLGEFLDSAPAAAAAAPAPAAASAPSPASLAAAAAEKPAPPRSATLMGMPALEMPPSKPLPAGVGVKSMKPGATPAPVPTKPAIPSVAATPTPKPSPMSPLAKPSAPARSLTPPSGAKVAAAPAPAAAPAGGAARPPMIAGQPTKPIRLVLASQAQAAAENTAQGGGLSAEQAQALTAVSREVLEQIIWEVVPDLAEAIIRENLDTLAAKAR